MSHTAVFSKCFHIWWI